MARTIAKDHDKKRAHLLRTAARVFAEEGVARASMSQVAAACGVSKANIYHYYDSKDALVFDILDSYLSALRDRVCGLDLMGYRPEERLRLIVREVLQAYEGMDDEHKIQTEGIALLPGRDQEVLKGHQREMVTRMSEILTEIEPQVFADHPSRLRDVTMSVFGMLNWFYMWNSQAGKTARDDYAGLVASLTLNGIRGL